MRLLIAEEMNQYNFEDDTLDVSTYWSENNASYRRQQEFIRRKLKIAEVQLGT